MIDELAQTIAETVKNVPGGVLMFFPSYKLMNDTYDRWSKMGGLDLISSNK